MADIMYLMGFKNAPPVGEYVYDPDQLHMTVVDSFSIPDKRLHDFIEKADYLIKWFSPIQLQVMYQDFFGEEKDIPVMKIVASNEITSLHLSFVDLIESMNGKVSNPVYSYDNYAPHVSYMDDVEDVWLFDTISLIEHRDGFGVNVWNHKNFSL